MVEDKTNKMREEEWRHQRQTPVSFQLFNRVWKKLGNYQEQLPTVQCILELGTLSHSNFFITPNWNYFCPIWEITRVTFSDLSSLDTNTNQKYKIHHFWNFFNLGFFFFCHLWRHPPEPQNVKIPACKRQWNIGNGCSSLRWIAEAGLKVPHFSMK